jgi:hypothetical protein
LSHIRNQLGNVFLVSSGDQAALPQLPFPFGGLGGKDMAGEGIASFDLATSGPLEPFGCAFVGLDLRHLYFSLVTV